jgi:hypothetical protein
VVYKTRDGFAKDLPGDAAKEELSVLLITFVLHQALAAIDCALRGGNLLLTQAHPTSCAKRC